MQTVSKFFTGFVDMQTNHNTSQNYRTTVRRMSEFFGPDRDLAAIRPSEADKYQKALQATLAKSTVNRELKRSKQLFAAYVRDYGGTNPFEHIRCGASKNKTRIQYVSIDTTKRLLDATDNAQYRLCIALSRFGGFRCMSETLLLRGDDIDARNKRIRVFSSKDGHQVRGQDYREIPLFHDLEPFLKNSLKVETKLVTAFGEVLDGDTKAINNAGCKFRYWLGKLIKKVGITPWSRLTHNLRASWIEDWRRKVPGHVVCAWAGNSEAVQHGHYLEVHDHHFEAALV